MTTTINYTAVENSEYVHGEWTGDRAEAVEAGVQRLDAERTEDGRYRYRDDATGSDYLVTEDDVATLGAAVLAGYTDVYSIWCSETDAEEVEEVGR